MAESSGAWREKWVLLVVTSPLLPQLPSSTRNLLGQLQGGRNRSHFILFCPIPVHPSDPISSHPVPSCPFLSQSMPTHPILFPRTEHVLGAGRCRTHSRPLCPQPPQVAVPAQRVSCVSAGSRLAPSPAKPQAPPSSGSWALTSPSWSPASLCPEPNELSQPKGTTSRVCAGLGPRRRTEPPFTPGLRRGQVGGVGLGGRP